MLNYYSICSLEQASQIELYVAAHGQRRHLKVSSNQPQYLTLVF